MLANIVSLVDCCCRYSKTIMLGVRNTHTIPIHGYISENKHFVKTLVKAAKTHDATVILALPTWFVYPGLMEV